jgi:hypothetical protein
LLEVFILFYEPLLEVYEEKRERKRKASTFGLAGTKSNATGHYTIKIDIPYFSCKPLSFLSPSLAYPLPP